MKNKKKKYKFNKNKRCTIVIKKSTFYRNKIVRFRFKMS